MSFRSYDLLNLVRDFGSEVTLRKTTSSGTYNPATGSVSGSATTDYKVQAYFFNYANSLPLGEEIRRSRSRCVLPALGLPVEPDDEDQIVGFGDAYNITRVSIIYSDGVAVCYLCDIGD